MKTFAGLVVSASLVAGHGYVNNATIDSDSYTFYQPYTDPYMSPTPSRISRPIQGNGPVEVVTWDDIQCGGDLADGIDGSSPANLTADVTAGSTVNLYWTLWPTSHVGPTITYMARCANDDCATYMPGNDTVWFKVQEEGRTGTSDTWGATAVMTAGGYVSYTVPECIESGAYLVRHEIIALHAAETEGGAQFYPGCHQVKVSGGGSTTPSDLVAFPGAYNATDPGILYNPYEATTYTIPGPALFSCSGSSSSSSSSSAAASSAVSTAAAVTSAASTSSFATVTTSASASSSAVATTAAAAAVVTGSDDDESCPDETSTAAQAATTSAASGDDDSCPDETVYLTITPAATTAQAAATGASSSDDGEDTCEEYTTSTVIDAQPTTIYETVSAGAQATETAAAAASSSTSSSSSSDSGSVATNPETSSSSSSSSSSDSGSVATNPETSSSSSSSSDSGSVATNPETSSSTSSSSASSTSAASSASTGDDSDDEGCDADGEGEGSSPTTTASSSSATTTSGSDDDDCDAEPTSQPSATASASSSSTGDDDDCNDEEELAYAQQYYKAAKIARGPRGMPLMFDH